MSSDCRLAAWHEAGHAAAISEVSGRVGGLELYGHGSGMTTTRDTFFRSLFVGSCYSRSDILLVGIAGCLAESWICHDSVESLLATQFFGNGRGDGDHVYEALEGDPLRQWIHKTERLISSLDREIQALAQLLEDQGRVDGDDARAILSGRY